MKKITDHEMKRRQLVSTAGLSLMQTIEEVNKGTGGLSLLEWLDALHDVANCMVKEQLKRDWRMRK
jgi:hypothetical protein